MVTLQYGSIHIVAWEVTHRHIAANCMAQTDENAEAYGEPCYSPPRYMVATTSHRHWAYFKRVTRDVATIGITKLTSSIRGHLHANSNVFGNAVVLRTPRLDRVAKPLIIYEINR